MNKVSASYVSKIHILWSSKYILYVLCDRLYGAVFTDVQERATWTLLETW